MGQKKRISSKERRRLLEENPDEREKIFKELCQHLQSGFSLDCFGPLSEVTIGKYLKEYPLEFVQEDFDSALRLGKGMWENIGKKQSTGECLGNSRSWYYNMSNRYKWSDKVDIEAEHKGQLSVQVVNYATPIDPQGIVDSNVT